MLEAILHGKNCSFVTLTYDEKIFERKQLPVPRSVEVAELQLWLKRLRKSLSPRKIRYFGVGEYGDQTFRPHYHAALFGLGPCRGGRQKSGECPCPSCSVVRETWGFGHVLVAPLERRSAQYIAGYVLKKMTHNQDSRLDGRNPEFARMSLKPGLGADAMHDVASVMMQYNLEKRGDVPTTLRHGSAFLPLGRYLRGVLREMVGKDKKAPPEAMERQAQAMQLLRAFAFANDRSVRSVFEELNVPYEIALRAKQSIHERRTL